MDENRDETGATGAIGNNIPQSGFVPEWTPTMQTDTFMVIFQSRSTRLTRYSKRDLSLFRTIR